MNRTKKILIRFALMEVPLIKLFLPFNINRECQHTICVHWNISERITEKLNDNAVIGVSMSSLFFAIKKNYVANVSLCDTMIIIINEPLM